MRLYFYDIEKPFKYGNDEENFKKERFLFGVLTQYGIGFSKHALNALHYIHGEGEDYQTNFRVVNELAAFCHRCDVISARIRWGNTEGLAG